jgi:hypothetical protein
MKRFHGNLLIVIALLFGFLSMAAVVAYASASLPMGGWLQLSGGYAQTLQQDEIIIDPANGSYTIEGWLNNPYFIDSSSVDTSHGTVYRTGSFSLFLSRITSFFPYPGSTTCNVAFASCSGSVCVYQQHNLGTYTAGSMCPAAGWVHFAFVYDQATSQAAFFWNGHMLGSDESVPQPSSQPIVLQKAGGMDELRISNASRYTASFTPASTPFECDAGTLALWHFDEIAGSTTFHDSCGSEDNTLTGFNGAHTEGITGSQIYLPFLAR